MREIKFRAWVDNGSKTEMCYPSEIDMNSAIADSLWYKVGYRNMFPEKRIISDWQKDIVFMQFTGLKDNNGKEIYEGDIIDLDLVEENNLGSVVFNDGCFKLLQKDTYYSNLYAYRPNILCKVIGNIYENPDLIKIINGKDE